MVGENSRIKELHKVRSQEPVRAGPVLVIDMLAVAIRLG